MEGHRSTKSRTRWAGSESGWDLITPDGGVLIYTYWILLQQIILVPRPFETPSQYLPTRNPPRQDLQLMPSERFSSSMSGISF